ncbi:TAXI family TRAP transporter solute-binding subunit, partial [Verrucomicrobiota bacterium]
IFLVAVGFILAYQFVGPPPPRTITMATGSEQGAYYHFGLEYAEWLKQQGIELRVRRTSGSTENLRLLGDDSSGVGLAFVQGGTGAGQEALLSLGSLYYEPLWVFHRRETPIHFLSDLKGLRIAIGSDFSGTRAIASLLARENGVDPDAFPATSKLSGTEAVAALKSGQVDAAFFVASPEAPLVKALLGDTDLALLSMDRAEAYTRRNAYLSQVHISEGMLNLELNIPSNNVQLISPTANLVIREDLHPALIDLVLQAAKSVHGGGGMFESPGEFPAPRLLEFPLSPEAARFYEYGPPFLQRFLPFWIATLVDRLKVLILPLVVILIPLFKIVPPTLRWRIRRKIIRWYKEIQALDIALDEEDAASRIDALRADIARIEREVTRVHVPLGYADQLYNLRLHIGVVRGKFGQFAGETDGRKKRAGNRP